MRAIVTTNKTRTISNHGFTLIELLVVIAILAVLSTIILASIGEVRSKAEVRKKNEIARQYINALELYANDHGGNYPATTGSECLGYSDASDDFCVGSTDGSDSLNDLLRPYYPNLPKNEEYSIDITSSYSSSGILYIFTPEQKRIYWYLPSSASCPLGIEPVQVGSATECRYQLSSS